MESHLVPGDPILVENIISYLKAMGIFDEFRHECLADVDTKSSCQNLKQRVDGYTSKFLATWNPDLNKNEVRNKLRKHLDESEMLAVGVDHVVEQVINPKIHQLFLPKIIEAVHQYLDKHEEKLNKKQEVVTSEKMSTEIPKMKATVLDPIADILSFTCSKPVFIPVENAQRKVSEALKGEKKKKVSHQTKPPDPVLKTGKPSKPPDVLPKIKKEEVADPADAVDNVLTSVKKEDIISPIKTETVKSPKELIKPSILIPETKRGDDYKELDFFNPVVECEAGFETLKKAENKDIKHEKKEVENLKLHIPEKLPQSEENSEIKYSSVTSDSSSKSKLVSVKHERNKPLGLGVGKPSSKVSEYRKSIVRESSDCSFDKLSTNQSKVPAKLSNIHTKDRSSLKNTISTKMVKCEKGGDYVKKSKSIGTPILNTPVSFEVGSLKKEDSLVKKHSSKKYERTKPLKVSDSKSDVKIQPDYSLSSDKERKQSPRYSSSYDSSQGSNRDRSSWSVSSKVKFKHFSKHQRKDFSSTKDSSSTDKPSSDKKRPQLNSDSGTPKKHKGQKGSKYPTEEPKKSITVQESAKITSRSNSIGSASSTSDSQTFLKEASISISSGETSDSSSNSISLKKKKPASKNKEPWFGTNYLQPPFPPTSGLSTKKALSAELFTFYETQSSQESKFESSEDIGSEFDEENLCNSSSNQESRLKPTELLSDMFASSSSEFEGFNSSPEKAPGKFVVDDVSVSSVHTSDLSSFEGELSDVECSNDQAVEGKSKKRFTIKEAEEILKAKAEWQHLEALKTVPQYISENKKTPKSSPQNSSTAATLSEVEVSSTLEPKRESRRERKLNPKYASNEYTSILNSKRTHFITKQSDQCEVKSADFKRMEADLIPAKKMHFPQDENPL